MSWAVRHSEWPKVEELIFIRYLGTRSSALVPLLQNMQNMRKASFPLWPRACPQRWAARKAEPGGTQPWYVLVIRWHGHHPMWTTPAMPGKEGENGGRPEIRSHPRYSLGSLEIMLERLALQVAEYAYVRSENTGLSEDTIVQTERTG